MRKRGQRIVAVTVGLAMAAGTLVASLAGSAGAAAPNIDPDLRPPEGQTAVKNGDTVTFDGSISPGSVIDEAFLRFLTPGLDKARNDIDVTGRLAIDSGRLAGTRVLPSLPAEADNGDVTLHVIAVNPDTGEESTGMSGGLAIDLFKPVITGTFLTSARKIRIDFSEPVHTPGIFENGDWRIDDTLLPPHAVSQPDGRADRRILDLAVIDEDKDEDATPLVEYAAEMIIGRAYEDRAGWVLGLPREVYSRDLVPPVAPTITELAGQASKNVLSNDPTPTIKMSGLRAGGRPHKGRLYLENGAQNGFQASGPSADSLIGIGENDGSGGTTIDTELGLGESGLGSDGTYTFYAVAADRALCAPPSGTEECPNLSAPDTATYTLDTIAPTPEFALMTEEGAQTIDVKFTEAVAPNGGDEINWTVTANGLPVLVDDVTGSGNARRLTMSSAIPPNVPVRVAWTPGNYADAAGNAMEAFDISAFDAIPPVVTLTDPLGRRYITAGAYTIRGISQRADSVDLLQDAGGAPIATVAPDASGAFSISVNLPEDGDYRFLVRGRRTTGGVEVTGEALAVPTITRDTAAPQAELLPLESDIFRGGEQTTVRWNATDANLGSGAIKIQFRRSQGAPWETIGTGGPTDTSLPWTVPAVNTNTAQIRVIATDRAGNASQPDFSGPFEIDSIAPRFDATTITPTTVRVKFTEPVTGVTDSSQWLISRDQEVSDRKPVAAVTHDAGAISQLTLETIPANGFGTNGLPEIIYTPMPHGQVFEDEAGNTVPLEEEPPPEGLPEFPHARTIAADGIIPMLALEETPRVIDAKRMDVAGAADSGEQNEAIARRRASSKGTQRYAVTVNDNGSFVLSPELRKNKRNRFDFMIQDPSGNVSEFTRVVIIEDSKKPRPVVKKPEGSTVRVGQKVKIRWKPREANKDTAKIIRQVKGATNKVIVSSTADDGKYNWKAASGLRGKKIRIKIITTDQAGHRGVALSRWMTAR